MATSRLAPGMLHVVATPIGHLQDLSPRAGQTLADADLVLCEDTRHSAPLLQHIGVKKPLWSLHAHNEDGQIAAVLQALQDGQQVALVSDAGTPCLSDPGARLVDAIQQAGLAVRTIPGPFAAAAGLAASGLTAVPFAFWGFLAKKSSERRSQLQARLTPGPEGPMTHAFYVPGRDAGEVLDDLAAVAPETRVCLCRELTKIHEGYLRGAPAAVRAQLTPEQERGEAVLLVEVRAPLEAVVVQSPQSLVAAARAAGEDRRDALQRLAKQTGLARKHLYALWLAAGMEEE
jgi:16S rRNA (cytidine1402-2'-O)-methyltransferase